MPGKRLVKELERLRADPIAGIELLSAEASVWTMRVSGAAGTLFEGEEMSLQFTFDAQYPFEAPACVFLDPVPVHPHVYSNGHICLSILAEEWAPSLTVSSVCLSLLSMLSSCKLKERPPDDKSYVRRVGKRSPKHTRWDFHDDDV